MKSTVLTDQFMELIFDVVGSAASRAKRARTQYWDGYRPDLPASYRMTRIKFVRRCPNISESYMTTSSEGPTCRPTETLTER